METRHVLAARAAVVADPPVNRLPAGDSAFARRQWDEALARGDRVDALLQVLPTATPSLAGERLGRLAQVHDPRIDLALLDWLVAMPFRTRPTCERFWKPLFDRLSKRGPTGVDWDAILDDVRARRTAFAMTHAERILKLTIPKTRDLTPGERSWLVSQGFAARPTTAPSSVSVEALFGRVWSAPADRSARRVLADALTEDGDPRGEFIATQLHSGIEISTWRCGKASYQKARNAEDTETAATLCELAAAHSDDWLGPWVSMICRIRWADGFPVFASPGAHLSKVGKLADAEALRTVRELSFPNTDRRGGIRRLLRSPVVENVQSVDGLFTSDLRLIGRGLPSLRRLSLFSRPEDLASLERGLRSCPDLEHLHLVNARSLVKWARPELGELAVETLTFEGVWGHDLGAELPRLIQALSPDVRQLRVGTSGVFEARRDDGFNTLMHSGTLRISEWNALRASHRIRSDGVLLAYPDDLPLLRETSDLQVDGRLPAVILGAEGSHDLKALLAALPPVEHLSIFWIPQEAVADVLRMLASLPVERATLGKHLYIRHTPGGPLELATVDRATRQVVQP
jgi:uncharacterized protein (TIGR02996 family)